MTLHDAVDRDRRLFVVTRRVRHRLAEIAVSELDAGGEDRLHDRVMARARDEYGSAVLMLLLPIVINILLPIVIEWWRSRRA